MKILLDTCAFIWWLEDSSKLGKRARKYISNPSNEVLVSGVSTWEISLKKAKGALQFPSDVNSILNSEGFTFLPISLAETLEVAKLPFVHHDPFDRLLIAQTMVYNCKLFTSGAEIMAYNISHLDCRK